LLPTYYGFLLAFLCSFLLKGSVALTQREQLTASMSFWTQKKVVVTGGRGFIGSHLVERLLEAGANVKVADSAHSNGAMNAGKISFMHLRPVRQTPL
jgi:NADPH:quinone reductase-like Zn-dependent oxidoreductase